MDQVNQILRVQCTERLVYWKHHHGVLGRTHLHSEGIHLNDQGQKALSASGKSLFVTTSIHCSSLKASWLTLSRQLMGVISLDKFGLFFFIIFR